MIGAICAFFRHFDLLEPPIRRGATAPLRANESWIPDLVVELPPPPTFSTVSVRSPGLSVTQSAENLARLPNTQRPAFGPWHTKSGTIRAALSS